MRVRWIRVCRWLLGVLGISSAIASCGDNGENNMLVEYGQPNMDFSVKGKVVDSVTGEGVAGIEVSHESYENQIDTTGTDGSFKISGNTFPGSTLSVLLRDVDPEKYGAYKSTETTVKLQQTGEGDGNWYCGTYEAGDVILKMEKQENE